MTKKIYLIDAMSYVFRAYYSFNSSLTNKEGFPTNAIYGFKNMLRRILEQKELQYLLLVFDADSKTFRSDIYPAYKANRQAAPEDLKQQFQPIFELVRVLNIASIKKDGWEADDLIAELSRKFAREVDEVVIVSGDKDLTQLINDKVSMYDSMKNIKYRKEEVKQKHGVYPEQIAEYLALIGDSADNIPGARGIGPKTAGALLDEYQSLANIYQNLANIKKSVSKKLADAKQNVDLSLKLTKLNHQLNLDCQLTDCILGTPEQTSLRKFYYNYGFAEDSLLNGSSQEAQAQKEIKRDYRLINTKAILQNYLEQIEDKKYFAFDLETTSLVVPEAKIVGIALAVAGLPAGYIPISHQEDSPQLELTETLRALQKIFDNPQITLIAHNLKYEVAVLKNYNIEPHNQLEDTMLQSYLLYSDTHQHGLTRLADIFLNYQCIPFERVVTNKNRAQFDEVPIKEAYIYAAEDADVTLQLYNIFTLALAKKNLTKLYKEVEIPLCLILAKIESKGVKINKQILYDLSKTIKTQAEQIAKAIYKETGSEFNINSPKQLGEVLFEKMAITEHCKRTKTGYATSSDILEKLSFKYPIAKKIHIYRSKQKLINSYLEVLPHLVRAQTGRIHTSYQQSITATGRLSSKDPNLQNIPIRGEDGERIRTAFIAQEGYCLICADYSQIELRLLAHFCKDEKLIRAFQEQKDIHSETASAIFKITQDKVDKEMRSVAKAINFGIIYGMGATKLAQEIKVSRKEASEFIATYFAKYPKIQEFIENTIICARKQEVVTTILGRIRRVKGINDKNAMLRSAMERIAVNTKIQGSAADLIKLAMIKIDKEARLANQMIMQIHDELVFETPLPTADSKMLLIKEQMQTAYQLLVPLKVEIKKGNNWNAAH